jgi:type IV pilus assembly protein PilC
MLSYIEMGSFFENMGMMIRAGISVSEAVDLLKDESEEEKSSLLPVFTCMSSNMDIGYSLEEAMKETGEFPKYATDMVGASEYTGRLEATLFHLSDYYRSENSMKNTFVSAIRYPAILLVMVIAVLVAMLAMVFPAFSGVYKNLTGGLYSSAFSYLGVSLTLCKVLLVVMIVMTVLLVAGVGMWRSGKTEGIKRFLSKFGTFKKMFDNLALLRFTSCFDMFIAGG